jgi:2-methylcitrate dehydratase PrpD
LLHGELTPALYEMAAIQDPRALALCDRMEILPDPEPTPTDGFRGRIRIDLADGRSVEQTRATNHGSPLDPMTDAELQAKFRAGFDSSGLRDRADATLAAIDRLERDGLRPLIAAFTPSNGKITLA